MLSGDCAIFSFADGFAAIPTSPAAEARNMVISLNKTSAFLWERLQTECTVQELAMALTDAYNVDEARCFGCGKSCGNTQSR